MVRRVSPMVACVGVIFAALGLVGPADLAGAEFAAGLAALAVLVGMRSAGAPIAGWPERLLLVSGLSLLAAAVIPALGWIAYLPLAGAAAVLVGRLNAAPDWRLAARPLEWLTLLAGLGAAAVVYIALPGHGVMLDLAQRVLLGVEIASLGVLAVRLLALAWVRAAPQLTIPTFPSMSLTRSK